MKIVLLSFGFIEYTLQLANSLCNRGSLKLILPDRTPSELKDSIDKRIDVFFFSLKRMRNPGDLISIWKVLRETTRFHPNVLHIQEGYLWLNVFLPLLKSYPIVTTVHDIQWHPGDKNYPMAIHNFAKTFSDQLIVHGNRLRETLIEKYGILPGKVNVIPHGNFSILRKWVKKYLREENNSILFFGRIWKYKGLQYLIEAEPLITREIPDAKIMIAGRGEDFKKYEKMMIHPEKFIVYNQYIPISMVAEIFQKCSVVVLPYIEASQSGVVPLAYTFGKPVVATDVGSISEVVDNGRTGYIVQPRDPRKLADAIVKILQDKQLQKDMELQASKKANKELSWEAIANQTFEVYRKAIRGFDA